MPKKDDGKITPNSAKLGITSAQLQAKGHQLGGIANHNLAEMKKQQFPNGFPKAPKKK